MIRFLSEPKGGTHEDDCQLGARCLRVRVHGVDGGGADAGGGVGGRRASRRPVGLAVDYETAGAAQGAALGECGSGCSVVLTFARCAAYAADQAAESTAVGWAESYGSAAAARQAALSECSLRGGSGCLVRVWGCNGPVVEEGLGLDRAAREQIQRGLGAAGFDPGGADGLFGPRTRAAIRRWQTSRGSRATGYLDGSSVAALRPSAVGQRTFRQREPSGADAAAPPGVSAAPPQPPPAASAEQENLFWQSVMNSTNPAEFEAYLRRFPNGLFSELAEARLARCARRRVRRARGSAASGSRPRPHRPPACPRRLPARASVARQGPAAVRRRSPTRVHNRVMCSGTATCVRRWW